MPVNQIGINRPAIFNAVSIFHTVKNAKFTILKDRNTTSCNAYNVKKVTISRMDIVYHVIYVSMASAIRPRENA